MRFIAIAMVMLIASTLSAEEKSVVEKWTLKLLPEKLPGLPDELYGKTWVHPGMRSRIGTGHDDHLSFRKAENDKPGQAAITNIAHGRAGSGPPKVTTVPSALRVERSLLEYGDGLRTAMIHDGKMVLNVGVPVGERIWYQVFTERFSDGKTRVNEWLFEFQDDPRKVKSGKLTVKHSRNIFPDHRPEKWEVPATFELKKESEYYRFVYLRHDNEPGKGRYRLPEVYFWPNAPYISTDDSDGRLVEFKPMK